MKVQLLKQWDRLQSSFWFVPSLMAAGAIGLAYTSVAVDGALAGDWPAALDWLGRGGAEGASVMLGTIASSMITIAGVVFSMTLVALSLASSQLGPRLLRNFMTDTVNQMVLGTFVSTFLYSLIVLRSIRRAEESLFVPHLSVSVAVVLAVASLGVLVYFIHHVALSIQADSAVAQIGDELNERIDDLFPAAVGGRRGEDMDVPDLDPADAKPVLARCDGYLQLIDLDALMRLATEHGLRLKLLRRTGHFVVKASPIMLAWPATHVDEQVRERIRDALVFDSRRTPIQDVEFALNQLVEVALRALSPGINDPFTAMACVDRLGAALSLLAQRDMPESRRFDDEGALRVSLPVVSFPDLVDASFDQIRQNARSSAAVTIRLLEAIAVVAAFTRHPADRGALRRHAEMMVRSAREALPEAGDREAAEARFDIALAAIEAPLAPNPAPMEDAS